MKKIILFAGLMVVFTVSLAEATLVKPINIETLTGLAQYIVKAEVTAKQDELDPYESGRMVTYYTLKVSDWIKGDPLNEDSEIVIKQLSDGAYTHDGIVVRQNLYFPKYETGKTYVFFLPSPHHTTGLLAPVGLWQGVFAVQTDTSGNETLPELKSPGRVNTLNKGLKKISTSKFLSLQVSDGKGSDASYASFKKMVKAVVEHE